MPKGKRRRRKQTDKRSRSSEVLLYVSPNCLKCKVLGTVLNDRGIAFSVRNIVRSARAMRELAELTGGRVKVPSLVIGERVLVDPDWRELSAALHIAPGRHEPDEKDHGAR